MNLARLAHSLLLDTKKSRVEVANCVLILLNYRTRAIITRGLYTFYPIFEGQKRLFRKILTLCTVSIQERFIIKSGL